ncbi:hypothetical protein [Hymenobacter edaphi]|uniref:hypothetical protein n=1 Tax=Hymenobacter edaphi TaxID=2211146 RepID=UPI001402CCC4|nr:hypothetical protein [Hymenobacter edaphi]
MPAVSPSPAPPVVLVHAALPVAPQFIDLAYLGSGRPIPATSQPEPVAPLRLSSAS